MNTGAGRETAPTRRDRVTYGGAVVGGGLLAGRAGDAGPASPTDAGAATSTDAGPTTAGTPPEEFSPSRVGAGTASERWRDLQAGDALATHGIVDARAGGGAVDYETLREVDPDATAVRRQGETSGAYVGVGDDRLFDRVGVADTVTGTEAP